MVNLQSALICAFAAFCLLTPLVSPPGLCAVPALGTVFDVEGDTTVIWSKTPIEDGKDCLGVIKKDQKLLIVRHGRHRADLQLYSSGKLLDTMPDITVDVDEDTYEPGEANENNPYDFFVSPDHRYLLVLRHLDRSVMVGYLYKRSGAGRMAEMQPGGLRLDAAALHDYCRRHRRQKESFLGRGERDIHFVQWDMARHRLIFTIESASSELGPSRFPSASSQAASASAYWYTAYDLKTGHFKIITHTKALPQPEY